MPDPSLSNSDISLNFSLTHPPNLRVSTFSTHSGQQSQGVSISGSKQSRTLANKKGDEQAMSVTLHAIDNSICYFNDTIKNNFINPLLAVRNAIEKLYSNQKLSDELQCFTLTYFSI